MGIEGVRARPEKKSDLLQTKKEIIMSRGHALVLFSLEGHPVKMDV
jgi:hypothetical protein